ncbi:hypothetical protein CHS0354_041909 [Potamilus streckersoni]|uniref:Aminopeptidase P N-terminal domain-containing protein n=1 Tax=Potamilus streckersoni TaxID=2493646 RepID=A0AAE0STV4_9BIVA|nr:hypothetical protein CHS0354_041909 [Potamilus streckersoni]
MAAPMKSWSLLGASKRVLIKTGFEHFHMGLSGSSSNSLPKLLKCVPSMSIWRRNFGQPAPQTHPHLLKEGEVTPGITKSEYEERRNMLVRSAVNSSPVKESVKSHIMIFPSASKTYMTKDIPYPFRQNTEFLYLCGFKEPDSVLVLECDILNKKINHKSVLFVPGKDPEKELWDGLRSGNTGSLQITGVSEAYNIEELGNYFNNYCKRHREYVVWYCFGAPPHKHFHEGIIGDFLKQSYNKPKEDTRQGVQKLQLIKSPAEIELMKTSIEIASQAFQNVIPFSYSGINEHHLYAKMDFECRIRNAQILAYPPVVADLLCLLFTGGNRANIIHYVNNDQLIKDGELVLMDAGCEYHGYSSDLTRTWPVSGKFTSSQRALYDAILHVQELCISMCTSDFSLDDIYFHMLRLLGIELQKLGLIPASLTKDQLIVKARAFCPHHVSHYLGMDIHDTADISRSIKLQDGMVVTIEPGVYIPKNSMDVPDEFKGIGIRIEDDILITSSEPVVLSASCPKQADEIEALFRH